MQLLSFLPNSLAPEKIEHGKKLGKDENMVAYCGKDLGADIIPKSGFHIFRSFPSSILPDTNDLCRWKSVKSWSMTDPKRELSNFDLFPKRKHWIGEGRCILTRARKTKCFNSHYASRNISSPREADSRYSLPQERKRLS